MSNIPISIHQDKDGNPDSIIVKIRTYAGDAIRDQHLKFPYGKTLLAKTIIDEMANREGQSPQGKQLCALWMIHEELELQVRSELNIFDLVKKWPKYLEKYTHNIEAIENPNSPYNSFMLIYKREAIISRNVERKCSDEASIRLFYGEARQNVLSGRYPCSVEDVITLAALQMQTMYGDYDKNKHIIGFLSSSESLNEFIPFYHYNTKDPEEWERLIFDKYKEYTGKNVYISRMLYLQYTRQWAFYGSSFFFACKNSPPGGLFQNRNERWIIGVNDSGMHIVDTKNPKILFSQTYERMKWNWTSDTIIFDYNSPRTGKDHHLTIITPQAYLVNSLACYAIKYEEKKKDLIEMKKNENRKSDNKKNDNKKTLKSKP